MLFESEGPMQGPGFNAEDYKLTWETGSEFGGLHVSSWPGVFAHGRLDEGTGLLLRQLPGLRISGRVLDLACGCGVIAARVSSLYPGCRITLTDVDALALRSARDTMSSNGFDARVLPADGFHGLDGKFDTVLSNPPFHRDAATNMRLGMQIMDPLRNFLAPRGQFIMVANRHLPYRQWLRQLFGGCEVLASTNRFQVLRAVQPG
jgi:16S rRNA (guanine1207-N2)-methyltransferase